MKKSTMFLGLAVAGLLGTQQVGISNQKATINKQSEKIASMKKANYEFATGKRKMKLENGQHIKTDKFELQYIQEGGKWSAVIYPTDKSTRILGEQGEGAKGLQLDNVPMQDTGLTTIISK